MKSRLVGRDPQMSNRETRKDIDEWVRVPDLELLQEELPEALRSDPIKVTDGLYFYRYRNLLVLPTAVGNKGEAGYEVRGASNCCATVGLAATTKTPFKIAKSEVFRYADKVGGLYNYGGVEDGFMEHVYRKLGFKKYKLAGEGLSVKQALEKYPNAMFNVKPKQSEFHETHIFASFEGQEVSEIGWAKAGGIKAGYPKFLSAFVLDPEQEVDVRGILRSAAESYGRVGTLLLRCWFFASAYGKVLHRGIRIEKRYY